MNTASRAARLLEQHESVR